MEGKVFVGAMYDEPSNLFDESAWLAFRQQMIDEIAAHPDWQDPVGSLLWADEHLAWIKEVKHVGRYDLLEAA